MTTFRFRASESPFKGAKSQITAARSENKTSQCKNRREAYTDGLQDENLEFRDISRNGFSHDVI